MATPAGTELTDDARGLRLVYRATPWDTEGRRIELDWYARPGALTAGRPHIHSPGAVESWELLEGEAIYRVGKEEHRVRAPHGWTIPANTSHVHPSNAGEGEMHVRQTIATETQAEALEGVARYFETLFALSAQGKVKPDGDIKDPLQQVLTIHELLMPGSWLAGPPRWLQRALFVPLAAVARATGRRAYVPAT
jgi:mannose-6-phosphate isomerase-like protein (cupin superfamily)